jgi:hypothetical protein
MGTKVGFGRDLDEEEILMRGEVRSEGNVDTERRETGRKAECEGILNGEGI